MPCFAGIEFIETHLNVFSGGSLWRWPSTRKPTLCFSLLLASVGFGGSSGHVHLAATSSKIPGTSPDTKDESFS
jgi:hypothetical protein